MLHILQFSANGSGRDMRRHIDLLENTLVVPFLATEVWLKVGTIPKEAAWFHAIAAFIPVVLYYVQNKSVDSKFQDAIRLISIVSLVIAGVLNSDYYIIGAAAAYGLGVFSFRKGKNCNNFNCSDMYNYALTGFVALALISLNGSLT